MVSRNVGKFSLFFYILLFLILRITLLQSVRELFFLDLVLGIVFFMQTGTGVLGNFFLLGHFTFSLLTGNRLRPIDSIFFHLALANSIVLISKGVPQTMVCLGMKMSLDHIGCKLIIFLHRVARSLSVSITCLLSAFQIITISPFTFSIKLKLKIHASKCISLFCLFCWILQLLIHSFMIMNMQNFVESSNNTQMWNIGFCSGFSSASLKVSLFVIMYSISDFLYVGFMVTASSYLMLLLQRHHQQVQHIHSSSQLSRKSPEIQATYTILVLVSTYVSFYSVNCIFSLYLFQFVKYDQWLIPTSALLAACYPATSPFVLISSDSQILNFFYSLWRKKRP
ncbi:vomeronasal type-1 receptor 3-like [Dromiciops gliroides]|uniref:vomeronasal type-1 receptor 3-like n=1 Tax=Dromiciops gliroides TaxID=33562 RepID=UPI001CC7C206|nr:vomeronasal type-1 receptor 3-like [Dromiciops gliroides]